MEEEPERRKAIALFMAFGTKGDVYPLAVISLSTLRISFEFWVLLGNKTKEGAFLFAGHCRSFRSCSTTLHCGFDVTFGS